MSFNLEHINILFHAPLLSVPVGRFVLFIYFCLRPGHILTQNKQFYFDSYLYVKCGREGGCWGLVIAPVLGYLLKQPFFSPGVVHDILSVD